MKPLLKPDLTPATVPPDTAEEMVLDLVKALGFYAVEWEDAGMMQKQGSVPKVCRIPTDELFSDAGKRAKLALINVNNWTKRRQLNAQAQRRRAAKTVGAG
jgi:hypothetical protein